MMSVLHMMLIVSVCRHLNSVKEMHKLLYLKHLRRLHINLTTAR